MLAEGRVNVSDLRDWGVYFMSDSVFRCLPLVAIAFALSACGGGGSGGVTPTPPPPVTPPPPPPTGQNEDLLSLTKNESFTNDAATASINVSSTGAVTGSANATQANFSYDVTSRGYTLSVAGRSINFLPSNIDASLSNDKITVYVKKSGDTTDSLTLTKAGTSGRLTYQYVGGGYWQRTTINATSGSGSVDSFAYGAASPDAAIPRTGRAEYLVDFVGAESMGSTVNGVVGQGLAQIDLNRGVMKISGALSPTGYGGTNFLSTAKLAASSNNFNGAFSYFTFGYGPITGQLSGRFYGPNAQEIGAAFSGRSANSEALISGTILGRGGAIHYATFDPTKVNAVSAGMTASFDNFNKSFTKGAVKNSSLIISFDAANNSYSLIANDQSAIIKSGETTQFVDDKDWLVGLIPGGLSNNKYLQGYTWFHSITDGNQIDYIIRPYITGEQTLASAVPLTGSAGFDTNIRGYIADSRFKEPRQLFGSGILKVDFATGKLLSEGSITATNPNEIFVGSYSAGGALGSNRNGFSGTMSTTGNIGTFNGDWNGAFFGPAMEQAGAAFSLSGNNGGVMAGIMDGYANAAITQAVPKLRDLKDPLQFTTENTLRSGWRPRINYNNLVMSYDPRTKTYSMNTNDFSLHNLEGNISFGPAERDNSASTDKFTVYKVDRPSNNVTIRVQNIDNSDPTVNLSYTSFADLFFESKDPTRASSNNSRIFALYGLPTPSAQMPRVGTASYTGSVTGEAIQGNISAEYKYYEVTGTSSFKADFQNQLLTGSLTMLGKQAGGLDTYDFGEFNMNGNLPMAFASDSFFSGNLNNPNGLFGSYRGGFYGPNAAEIGVLFNAEGRLNGINTVMQGVATGKQK